ncbi:MAG: peptide chain release factor 1 [Bacteroidetes bacterium]|nr:MAG: peptide chain release factor 1 [Bacteroidota bacterium]
MSKNMILDKLEGVFDRYKEVERLLSDPSVASNQENYVKLSKEYKNLEPIINAYKELKNIIENIESSKIMLHDEDDDEMKQMAKDEIDTLTKRKEELEEEIKILLLPKDPEDDKNAIVEIRAGTGGDEAGIFAGDLFRMYTKFCEIKGWKIDINNITEGTQGGYKEIVFQVTGKGVYGILKYESGVHRVQRVPDTETQGRVHTSAASVAILPEAEDIDIEINDADVRKDTYCSSGPGGQSVNTTYSAIRLTHIPTGLVVTCQDEKSQIKNLKKAMKELKTRLYNLEYQKYLDKISSKRKTMVSGGDRSAKIRTYNYPQGRVTDHRIKLTLYNLQNILNGDITEIIEKLQIAENTEKLKASGME